jgi:hypothetical protein
MNHARRTAPDAPPAWYRRLFRRTTRQRPPSAAVVIHAPSLKPWELRTLVLLALLILLAVIAAAAAISYSHMHDWAKLNGEQPWRAILSPIPVDGAIAAGGIVIFVDARLRNPRDWVAYLVVIISVAWSVFANVAHDWVSELAAKMIAAWPPIALAATVELLLRLTRRLRERSDRVRQETPAEDDGVEPDAPSTPEIVEPVVVEPEAVPVEPDPVPAVESVPAPVADVTSSEIASLTEEMHEAGWTPEQYATVGKAMRGYLEKVDSNLTGSELWQAVAIRYFGAVGPDTGTGRRVVQEYKADRARASEAAGMSGRE